jgi:hypothetical protein
MTTTLVMQAPGSPHFYPCPLPPPQVSGKVYLAAAAGSWHKMKTGSSCSPPSTGVFPSSEDLGPEPASCSGGGPGLQGKKEKCRPSARTSSTLPLHFCPPNSLSMRPASLLPCMRVRIKGTGNQLCLWQGAGNKFGVKKTTIPISQESILLKLNFLLLKTFY